MGYGDHDDDGFVEPSPGFAGYANMVLTLVVRLVGLAVLSVGIWAGAKVLLEGFALYESPERIERLADAIEQGSNLDALFATVAPAADAADAPLAEGEEPVVAPAPVAAPGPSLRLSYFAAWFVALMLLLVLGMLAMSAISTGGQLALREFPVRRISREVAREVRRLRRAA